MTRYLTTYFFFILSLINVAAQAGGGHEHGAEGHGREAEVSMPAEPASPRLLMESAQFELAGILEHDGLILYLDDYASNAPVTDARLELELASQRISAKANKDGSYYAALAKPYGPGKYPVLVTVLAGKTSDFLVGDLLIPEQKHPHEEVSAALQNTMLPWWIAGAISLLAIILVTVQRDRHTRRETA